jgi:hypothetical protein
MYDTIRNRKWNMKCEIEDQWTTLTHEEFAEMEIKQEKLASMLQEYGDSKDEIDITLDTF